MTNYYKILGLKDFATAEQVKTAYRKLCKKFHPDVNDNDPFFVERFKEIQTAYEVLTNNRKKALHDDDLKRFKEYTSQLSDKQQQAPNYTRQQRVYNNHRRKPSGPRVRLSKTTTRIIYMACVILITTFYLLIAEEKAAQEIPTINSPHFSIGLSSSDVYRAQGEPTSSYHYNNLVTWFYDSSLVVFRNDTVVEIYNRSGNLKIIPTSTPQ